MDYKLGSYTEGLGLWEMSGEIEIEIEICFRVCVFVCVCVCVCVCLACSSVFCWHS